MTLCRSSAVALQQLAVSAAAVQHFHAATATRSDAAAAVLLMLMPRMPSYTEYRGCYPLQLKTIPAQNHTPKKNKSKNGMHSLVLVEAVKGVRRPQQRYSFTTVA